MIEDLTVLSFHTATQTTIAVPRRPAACGAAHTRIGIVPVDIVLALPATASASHALKSACSAARSDIGLACHGQQLTPSSFPGR